MKKIFYLVLLLIVVGGVGLYVSRVRESAITEDLIIDGDYTVESGKRLVLEQGAMLEVNGNLTVSGEIACALGGLTIVVHGNTVINSTISCTSENDDGIAIVAEGDLDITENAEITSDGNIQIVESANLLAQSDEEFERLFNDAADDSGNGLRIGPFIDEEAVSGNSSKPRSISAIASLFAVPDAQAQAAGRNVIIRGRTKVNTPPKGVRRIVVINFPSAANVTVQNYQLDGPNGRKGDDGSKTCNSIGKDGEKAFRFLAFAPNLEVKSFTLTLGSGGDGGKGETDKDCNPGIAQGGNGGEAGNFKMVASREFKITGAFIINPGRGGAGGAAIASGKDGVAGEDGGDATATGGKGADNKKKLRISGTVAGTNNVQVGSVMGGTGGTAAAAGGSGGSATECGVDGGNGGDATATGGNGGDSSLTLAGGIGRTSAAEDVGGKGGDTDTGGAKAGNGGSCGPDKKGGGGGAGGDAASEAGMGGTGSTRAGADGAKLHETGGDGGDGGDGCTEGKGGDGGAGTVEGADGNNGKNLCGLSAEDETFVSPDEEEVIEVIQYQGKYIPIDQLIIESEVGCGADHWHAAEGVAFATDGTPIPDPGPPCGYGKLQNVPVMSI